MKNKTKYIQVTPNIVQSVEDYDANIRFDEARDEALMSELNINN